VGLRHLKDEVNTVNKGTECGMTITNYTDVRSGDVIQLFDKIEKPGVL
jgi:translation initiation factor IF-2